MNNRQLAELAKMNLMELLNLAQMDDEVCECECCCSCEPPMLLIPGGGVLMPYMAKARLTEIREALQSKGY